jgi:hypothetical protein
MSRSIAHRKSSLAISIFIVIVLLVGFLGTADMQNATAQTFLTYTNLDYGISIDYPEDWEIEEGFLGSIASFTSPLVGDSDDFSENANLAFEPVSGMSLDEYVDLSIENIGQIANDFELISDSPTTISNNAARKLVYTHAAGQYELKVMQTISLANAGAYIFTFTALIAEYSNYISTAEEILDSLQISVVMLRYESMEHGVQIDYPDYWEVAEGTRLAENVDAVVYFYPPLEGESDIFEENVNVVIEYLEPGTSLDGYTDSALALIESLTTDFRLVESTDVTISGNVGHKVVYTGKQGINSLKTMQVYTVIDDKAYVLSYNAISSTYSEHLPIVEDMIDSLTLAVTPKFEKVSGTYVDSETQLEIEFPDGWTGVKVLGFPVVSPTGLNFSSGAAPETMMMVIQFERSALQDWLAGGELELGQEINVPVDENLECNTISQNYLKINGMGAVKIVQECADQEGSYSKINAYGLVNDKNLIVIGLLASSEEAYNSNVQGFEESIETIRFEGVADFKSAMISILDLKTQVHPVVAAGANVEVKIDSSSQVSDFTFEEENKKIAFTVEGREGTRGHSIVSVGDVLEGDYVVAIDGNAATDYSVAEDEETGEITVELTYDHSERRISITGTNVVPEFPTSVALTIALSLTVLMIASKISTRRFSY